MVDTGIYGQCVGYEKLTVSGTVKQLTNAKYYQVSAFASCNARVAVITVDGTAGTNDIRYTFDGTAPVATTTGHLLAAKAEGLVVRGLGNIVGLQMIKDGSDAVVHISYYL